MFQRYEDSSLNQREFGRQNQLSPSTFFSKRRLLKLAKGEKQSGFAEQKWLKMWLAIRLRIPL
ncbi:hypothetical protein [Vibrio navarrensis]|uniref:hypothetical protein n=1 Tax=Vibrio navarrensis TaxID=29495 RepID=UPI0039AF2B6D